MMKKSITTLAVCAGLSINAHADFTDKLSRLVGYSVVLAGTITGFQDSNKKRNDSFEGCEYGRRIFIDDRYQVTCATYSYSYSYRPSVVILSQGSSFKMVVGDEIYDITK
jgi:hypothetical protein